MQKSASIGNVVFETPQLPTATNSVSSRPNLYIPVPKPVEKPKPVEISKIPKVVPSKPTPTEVPQLVEQPKVEPPKVEPPKIEPLKPTPTEITKLVDSNYVADLNPIVSLPKLVEQPKIEPSRPVKVPTETIETKQESESEDNSFCKFS